MTITTFSCMSSRAVPHFPAMSSSFILLDIIYQCVLSVSLLCNWEAIDCWPHVTFYYGYKLIPSVLISSSYNWFNELSSCLTEKTPILSILFISGDKYHMSSFYWHCSFILIIQIFPPPPQHLFLSFTNYFIRILTDCCANPLPFFINIFAA
jgi:hypothetical protein